MEPSEDAIADGRSLVQTNLLRIVWVSAVVAWLSAPMLGAAAWLRLAMIVLVCVLVYRGLRGALWVLGALTVFAGVGMSVLAVIRAELHWSTRVMFAVLGAVQVLAFVILLKAPEVRRFMEHQRGRGAGR